MAHTPNTHRNGRRTAEELRDAAEETKGIVQDVATDVMESAKKAGVQAKEMVQERWDDLKSTAGDYAEQARDKFSKTEKAVEKRIKNRPFVSLLMAVGF
jgi:ElaB/YqjD/DUF883 family membrane-anchored ribosome-binding protein